MDKTSWMHKKKLFTLSGREGEGNPKNVQANENKFFSGLYGIIESPEFPLYYPNNKQDCQFPGWRCAPFI